MEVRLCNALKSYTKIFSLSCGLQISYSLYQKIFILKTTKTIYTVLLRKIRRFTEFRWFTTLLEMLITPALILMCGT